MTDKELIQQAFNALNKMTDLFPDARGGHSQEAEDACNAALVVMADLAARLQQPEQKTCDDILAPEQSAMCANDIEHFHAYAKEFILPITLKSLIESHKKLCRISQIKNDEWLKELAAATELGRKQGLEFVTEHEFVSVEKLKLMTINELVYFLYDGV